jgi:hypothetical protein
VSDARVVSGVFVKEQTKKKKKSPINQNQKVAEEKKIHIVDIF